MSLSPTERADRIERYARGPARLREALGRVPEEARQWRPGPGKWSVHEVVCHCADSELNAAARIRYLVAEKEPVIVGYDQEEWARRFDYHQLPLDTALQTVEAVRATTVALLRRLPTDAWTRQGRHTESGPYGVTMALPTPAPRSTAARSSGTSSLEAAQGVRRRLTCALRGRSALLIFFTCALFVRRPRRASGISRPWPSSGPAEGMKPTALA